MTFNKTFLKERRFRLNRKFAVYRYLPEKKVFRKGNLYFWQLLFFLAVFIFLYWKLKSDEFSPTLLMILFVVSVFLIGFLVKFTLSQIFPEVVLDERGIKIRGVKKIRWEEISSLKIDTSFDLFADVKLKNSKQIRQRLENSKPEILQKYCRSFFKKYRN
ncbi:hypothetical protein MTP09_03460 [Chryseobacterium suipulveris]|uniref:PH domain-containing protein n=1 Tax=Chryseobacterium suipulveris TaxID=2929800 RepID=A0ABY4BR79_9FLAO|nr:hypothetical protein [Chryseobacterium suipulveris]UOE41708.1 hypothetical protein MTP09_03460 [Chryseobacterium suipulveris]